MKGGRIVFNAAAFIKALFLYHRMISLALNNGFGVLGVGGGVNRAYSKASLRIIQRPSENLYTNHKETCMTLSSSDS